MIGALVELDIGTSAVKAVAISPTARCSGSPRKSFPLSVRPANRPSRIRRIGGARAQASSRASTEEARSSSPARCTGSSHSAASDQLLRPAILWNDGRTAAGRTEEIESQLGLDRLVSLTGNRALAGFTAPKLLWLRRHEPETYSQIRQVLLPKDYIHLRLTGEHATDVSDASGTLLFDVGARRWSEEVCAALEIPGEWLPPAFESTVVGGAGDQAAAALGVGIDRPGPVSVALGTAGIVFAVTPSYAPDAQARLHTFCHAVPDTWHAMGVMLSGGGSFAWLRDLFQTDAAQLDREAAAWAPGCEGLLFAPYLAGERTPAFRPCCARRVHRALAPSRPRRARARDHGGRRLRAARLARAAPGRGRAARGGADLRRRLAERHLDADRRVGARPAARTDRVRRGIGLRCGAPRRGPLRGLR